MIFHNVAFSSVILNYFIMLELHKKKGVFHNFGNRCIFCQKEKTDMLELFINDGWRN